MANINEDLYILGQSEVKSISNVGEEIRLDLALKANPNLNAGKVYGIVQISGSSQPVAGALVKIMDSNFEPMYHTISGADGSYIFDTIPPGNKYNIFAIADGMLLAQEAPFDVGPNDEILKVCNLQPDNSINLGIISGSIMDDQVPSEIVDGAVIRLFRITQTGTEVLDSVTYSNEYGQFIFRDVDVNSYKIRVSSLGYISTSTKMNIDKPGQIVSLKITIRVDPNTSRGTVSGMVTENNNPIDRAEVLLYRVNSDGLSIPMASTKTNSSGVYLFINVPEGNYRIMSNKITEVTVS